MRAAPSGRMMTHDCDIAVVGGGLAGLTAAAVLAGEGFDVICCSMQERAGGRARDNRVTAFLGTSIDLLKESVDWESVASHARSLTVMRVADAAPEASRGIQIREFRADMIGETRFGYAVPNRILAAALEQRISASPNAGILRGAEATGIFARLSEVTVKLKDGSRVRGRLAVAADGRDSVLRSAAEIPVKRIGFGQKSLSFDVTHDSPHQDETIEIHASGGPFTLVPIEEIHGRPASAAVWMEFGPEAERLQRLGAGEFEAEANRRSFGLRGKLSLSGPRRLWPAIGQIASRFAGDRLALIGEAAHVVPPIGAQGLNMTMADIRALADLVSGNRSGLGSADVLERYSRVRRASATARLAGVMALDWVSSVDGGWMRSLRRRGLSSLVSAPPVRNRLMRLGMTPDAPAGLSPWPCIRKIYS